MASSYKLMRPLAAFLSVAYFLTNAVFAHAAEANFWAERRRAARPAAAEDGRFASVPAGYRAADAGLILQNVQVTSVPPISASLPAHIQENLSGEFKGKHGGLIAALPLAHSQVRRISSARRPDAPVVLHIQDVHRNAEAQANIALSLRALFDGDAVDLVALEGAFDPFDLRRFRAFPHRDSVQAAADDLLRENKISGPIHAALSSPVPIPPIAGIDDPQHYNANVNAYRQSVPLKEAARKQLEALQQAVAAEKEKKFSPELSAFDRQVEAYHRGELPLGDYATLVSREGQAPEGDLAAFLKALALEKTLEFARVERERKEIIDGLMRRMGEADIRALVEHSIAYRAGRIGYGDFYRYLRDLCGKKAVNLSRFPAMEAYLRYVLTSDGIQSERLMAQLAAAEAAAYDRLVAVKAERDLLDRAKRLSLTSKLLDFSLTPEEWREYVAATQRPGLSDGIADKGFGLSSFESFYREAEARNEAMVENVLKALSGQNQPPATKHRPPVAVLVTGGFHSAGMEALMRGRDVNFITLAPKVTKVDGLSGSAYLSVFAREKTPIEKLFEGEKLFVADNPLGKAVLGWDLPRGIALHKARLHPNGFTVQNILQMLARVPGGIKKIIVKKNGAVRVVSNQGAVINGNEVARVKEPFARAGQWGTAYLMPILAMFVAPLLMGFAPAGPFLQISDISLSAVQIELGAAIVALSAYIILLKTVDRREPRIFVPRTLVLGSVIMTIFILNRWVPWAPGSSLLQCLGVALFVTVSVFVLSTFFLNTLNSFFSWLGIDDWVRKNVTPFSPNKVEISGAPAGRNSELEELEQVFEVLGVALGMSEARQSVRWRGEYLKALFIWLPITIALSVGFPILLQWFLNEIGGGSLGAFQEVARGAAALPALAGMIFFRRTPSPDVAEVESSGAETGEKSNRQFLRGWLIPARAIIVAPLLMGFAPAGDVVSGLARGGLYESTRFAMAMGGVFEVLLSARVLAMGAIMLWLLSAFLYFFLRNIFSSSRNNNETATGIIKFEDYGDYQQYVENGKRERAEQKKKEARSASVKNNIRRILTISVVMGAVLDLTAFIVGRESIYMVAMQSPAAIFIMSPMHPFAVVVLIVIPLALFMIREMQRSRIESKNLQRFIWKVFMGIFAVVSVLWIENPWAGVIGAVFGVYGITFLKILWGDVEKSKLSFVLSAFTEEIGFRGILFPLQVISSVRLLETVSGGANLPAYLIGFALAIIINAVVVTIAHMHLVTKWGTSESQIESLLIHFKEALLLPIYLSLTTALALSLGASFEISMLIGVLVSTGAHLLDSNVERRGKKWDRTIERAQSGSDLSLSLPVGILFTAVAWAIWGPMVALAAAAAYLLAYAGFHYAVGHFLFQNTKVAILKLLGKPAGDMVSPKIKFDFWGAFGPRTYIQGSEGWSGLAGSTFGAVVSGLLLWGVTGLSNGPPNAFIQVFFAASLLANALFLLTSWTDWKDLITRKINQVDGNPLTIFGGKFLRWGIAALALAIAPLVMGFAPAQVKISLSWLSKLILFLFMALPIVALFGRLFDWMQPDKGDEMTLSKAREMLTEMEGARRKGGLKPFQEEDLSRRISKIRKIIASVAEDLKYFKESEDSTLGELKTKNWNQDRIAWYVLTSLKIFDRRYEMIGDLRWLYSQANVWEYSELNPKNRKDNPKSIPLTLAAVVIWAGLGAIALVGLGPQAGAWRIILPAAAWMIAVVTAFDFGMMFSARSGILPDRGLIPEFQELMSGTGMTGPPIVAPKSRSRILENDHGTISAADFDTLRRLPHWFQSYLYTRETNVLQKRFGAAGDFVLYLLGDQILLLRQFLLTSWTDWKDVIRELSSDFSLPKIKFNSWYVAMPPSVVSVTSGFTSMGRMTQSGNSAQSWGIWSVLAFILYVVSVARGIWLGQKLDSEGVSINELVKIARKWKMSRFVSRGLFVVLSWCMINIFSHGLIVQYTLANSLLQFSIHPLLAGFLIAVPVAFFVFSFMGGFNYFGLFGYLISVAGAGALLTALPSPLTGIIPIVWGMFGLIGVTKFIDTNKSIGNLIGVALIEEIVFKGILLPIHVISLTNFMLNYLALDIFTALLMGIVSAIVANGIIFVIAHAGSKQFPWTFDNIVINPAGFVLAFLLPFGALLYLGVPIALSLGVGIVISTFFHVVYSKPAFDKANDGSATSPTGVWLAQKIGGDKLARWYVKNPWIESVMVGLATGLLAIGIVYSPVGSLLRAVPPMLGALFLPAIFALSHFPQIFPFVQNWLSRHSHKSVQHWIDRNRFDFSMSGPKVALFSVLFYLAGVVTLRVSTIEMHVAHIMLWVGIVVIQYLIDKPRPSPWNMPFPERLDEEIVAYKNKSQSAPPTNRKRMLREVMAWWLDRGHYQDVFPYLADLALPNHEPFNPGASPQEMQRWMQDRSGAGQGEKWLDEQRQKLKKLKKGFKLDEFFAPENAVSLKDAQALLDSIGKRFYCWADEDPTGERAKAMEVLVEWMTDRNDDFTPLLELEKAIDAEEENLRLASSEDNKKVFEDKIKELYQQFNDKYQQLLEMEKSSDTADVEHSYPNDRVEIMYRVFREYWGYVEEGIFREMKQAGFRSANIVPIGMARQGAANARAAGKEIVKKRMTGSRRFIRPRNHGAGLVERFDRRIIVKFDRTDINVQTGYFHRQVKKVLDDPNGVIAVMDHVTNTGSSIVEMVKILKAMGVPGFKIKVVLFAADTKGIANILRAEGLGDISVFTAGYSKAIPTDGGKVDNQIGDGIFERIKPFAGYVIRLGKRFFKFVKNLGITSWLVQELNHPDKEYVLKVAVGSSEMDMSKAIETGVLRWKNHQILLFRKVGKWMESFFVFPEILEPREGAVLKPYVGKLEDVNLYIIDGRGRIGRLKRALHAVGRMALLVLAIKLAVEEKVMIPEGGLKVDPMTGQVKLVSQIGVATLGLPDSRVRRFFHLSGLWIADAWLGRFRLTQDRTAYPEIEVNLPNDLKKFPWDVDPKYFAIGVDYREMSNKNGAQPGEKEIQIRRVEEDNFSSLQKLTWLVDEIDQYFQTHPERLSVAGIEADDESGDNYLHDILSKSIEDDPQKAMRTITQLLMLKDEPVWRERMSQVSNKLKEMADRHSFETVGVIEKMIGDLQSGIPFFLFRSYFLSTDQGLLHALDVLDADLKTMEVRPDILQSERYSKDEIIQIHIGVALYRDLTKAYIGKTDSTINGALAEAVLKKVNRVDRTNTYHRKIIPHIRNECVVYGYQTTQDPRATGESHGSYHSGDIVNILLRALRVTKSWRDITPADLIGIVPDPGPMHEALGKLAILIDEFNDKKLWHPDNIPTLADIFSKFTYELKQFLAYRAAEEGVITFPAEKRDYLRERLLSLYPDANLEDVLGRSSEREWVVSFARGPTEAPVTLRIQISHELSLIVDPSSHSPAQNRFVNAKSPVDVIFQDILFRPTFGAEAGKIVIAHEIEEIFAKRDGLGDEQAHRQALRQAPSNAEGIVSEALTQSLGAEEIFLGLRFWIHRGDLDPIRPALERVLTEEQRNELSALVATTAGFTAFQTITRARFEDFMMEAGWMPNVLETPEVRRFAFTVFLEYLNLATRREWLFENFNPEELLVLERIIYDYLASALRGNNNTADVSGPSAWAEGLDELTRRLFDGQHPLQNAKSWAESAEKEQASFLGEGYHSIAWAYDFDGIPMTVKYVKSLPDDYEQNDWSRDHSTMEGRLQPDVWEYLRLFESYGQFSTYVKVFISDDVFNNLLPDEKRDIERYVRIGIVERLRRPIVLRPNIDSIADAEKREKFKDIDGIEVSVAVVMPQVTPSRKELEPLSVARDKEGLRMWLGRYLRFVATYWEGGGYDSDASLVNVGIWKIDGRFRMVIFDVFHRYLDFDKLRPAEIDLSGVGANRERTFMESLVGHLDGSLYELEEVYRILSKMLSEVEELQKVDGAMEIIRTLMDQIKGFFTEENFLSLWPRDRPPINLNSTMLAQREYLIQHPLFKTIRDVLENADHNSTGRFPVMVETHSPGVDMVAGVRPWTMPDGKTHPLIVAVNPSGSVEGKAWGKIRFDTERLKQMGIRNDSRINYRLVDLVTGERYFKNGRQLHENGLDIGLPSYAAHAFLVEDVEFMVLADGQMSKLENIPVVEKYYSERARSAIPPFAAIGDIHGQYDLFVQALETIGYIRREASNVVWTGGAGELLLTGDVGHGPQLAEVYALVQSLAVQAHQSGGKIIWLLGNHDMFEDGQGGPTSVGFDIWPKVREIALGQKTVPGLEIKIAHTANGRLFVHGGLLPAKWESIRKNMAGDDFSVERQADWINQWFNEVLRKNERLTAEIISSYWEMLDSGTAHRGPESIFPQTPGYVPAGIVTADAREIDDARHHHREDWVAMSPQAGGHNRDKIAGIGVTPDGKFIFMDVGRDNDVAPENNGVVLFVDGAWLARYPYGRTEVLTLDPEARELALSLLEKKNPRATIPALIWLAERLGAVAEKITPLRALGASPRSFAHAYIRNAGRLENGLLLIASGILSVQILGGAMPLLQAFYWVAGFVALFAGSHAFMKDIAAKYGVRPGWEKIAVVSLWVLAAMGLTVFSADQIRLGAEGAIVLLTGFAAAALWLWGVVAHQRINEESMESSARAAGWQTAEALIKVQQILDLMKRPEGLSDSERELLGKEVSAMLDEAALNLGLDRGENPLMAIHEHVSREMTTERQFFFDETLRQRLDEEYPGITPARAALLMDNAVVESDEKSRAGSELLIKEPAKRNYLIVNPTWHDADDASLRRAIKMALSAGDQGFTFWVADEVSRQIVNEAIAKELEVAAPAGKLTVEINASVFTVVKGKVPVVNLLALREQLRALGMLDQGLRFFVSSGMELNEFGLTVAEVDDLARDISLWILNELMNAMPVRAESGAIKNWIDSHNRLLQSA